jgi:hypothetical protein
MSEFKGTKGKWVIGINDDQTVLTDNGAYRPNAMQITTSTKIELKANALLISKAPEMLAMLEDIYSKYERDQHLLNVSPSKIQQLIKEAKEL